MRIAPLVSILLFACSSPMTPEDGGSGLDAHADAPSSTPDAALDAALDAAPDAYVDVGVFECEQRARRRCARYHACARGLNAFTSGSIEECERIERRDCEYRSTFAGPTPSDACLETLEADCEWVTNGWPACIHGTGSLGTPCRADMQCSVGLRCDTTGNIEPECDSGECAPLLALGETGCSYTTDCAPGLACDDRGVGTCVQRSVEGEPCAPFPGCGEGLFCGASERCERASAPGEPCDPFGPRDQCGSTLYECRSRTCTLVEWALDGEPCGTASDGSCLGTCTENVCDWQSYANAGLGESCEGAGCKFGYGCFDGTCGPAPCE